MLNIQEQANKLAKENGYEVATPVGKIDGVMVFIPQSGKNNIGIIGLPPVITAIRNNVKWITGQAGFDIYGKAIDNPQTSRKLEETLKRLMK